jgi:ribosomal protein S18 acetylase RimI-like enzyme
MIHTIIADLTKPQHAIDFMVVLSDYAKDPMGGGEALPSYVKENLVAKLLEQQNNVIVLCYVDNEIAGISNCFYGFSSFKAKSLINIHDFAILPAHRGKGLSKHLLDKVEEIALENDCCKITLEVLENNAKAKRVYQSFGFEGYELNPEMGKAIFWQKVL